jgi:diaminopimelate decarboxylase
VTPALAGALREAAGRYGTPLYLYDLPRLAADGAAIRAAFPDPWLRLYSLKANGLPPLVREIWNHGFGASAVSGGELEQARRAGVPLSVTALEGIGKSDADLDRAAAHAAAGDPLLWVSLETADEAAVMRDALLRARRRAHQPDLRQDVVVRLNPGVAPETIAGLAVGAAESKFGCLPEELPAVVEAGGGPEGPLRWRGIHVHIGSQLGAVDAWRSAFRRSLRVLELQRARLPDFDTLDAGSGFPVAMADPDSVPGVELFAAEARAELERVPASAAPARLAVEPGRAVVAGAGWLVGRVLHVRRREQPMVVLDTGMTELIRTALYGAHHPMVALSSLGRPTDGEPGEAISVRVDGPVCESTDTLGPAELPPLRRGDLVALGLAGAYGSAMASTYNGRPRPPEAAWDGQRTRLLRRRGRLESLP